MKDYDKIMSRIGQLIGLSLAIIISSIIQKGFSMTVIIKIAAIAGLLGLAVVVYLVRGRNRAITDINSDTPHLSL